MKTSCLMTHYSTGQRPRTPGERAKEINIYSTLEISYESSLTHIIYIIKVRDKPRGNNSAVLQHGNEKERNKEMDERTGALTSQTLSTGKRSAAKKHVYY